MPGLTTAERRPRRWSALWRAPTGVIALTGAAVLIVVAILGPILWGHTAAHIDVLSRQQAPSGAHWLGTDSLGRDVLARVLVATRFSLELAVLATALGLSSGLLLGTVPTVLGRRAARLVTGAVNLLVAFPSLLLALFLAVVFGVGTTGALLAIGLAMAPHFARLAQTLAASAAGRDYVAAARVVGVGRARRLIRHILPNIAEPLVIQGTLSMGGALGAFAGLSYLGLGVQPPGYDWGRLLSEGLSQVYVRPAAALAPGAAVVFASITVQLLGEALAAVVGLRADRPRLGLVPRPRRTPRPTDLTDTDDVLVVEGLRVSFPTAAGYATPVHDVSFRVRAGEMVGIVGESGSGKSLTALATGGLIASPAVLTAHRLDFTGVSLIRPDGTPLGRPDPQLRRLLGTSMAMVFQDPMTSLNPALRVGRQLAEVAEVHDRLSKKDARRRAVDRLRDVRIPDPQRRARQYPHEYSGGMRQRAMIGIGMMEKPRLIIADEPTTALDVRVQRQVLGLLHRLRERNRSSVLLISHDVAVVTALCSRVLVMYGGTVVEDIAVDRLLSAAAHPYTRALLAAVPRMDADRSRPLVTIPGRPPDPADPPPGCPFAPRCERADQECREQRPPLIQLGADRVACWHPHRSPAAPVDEPTP